MRLLSGQQIWWVQEPANPRMYFLEVDDGNLTLAGFLEEIGGGWRFTMRGAWADLKHHILGSRTLAEAKATSEDIWRAMDATLRLT